MFLDRVEKLLLFFMILLCNRIGAMCEECVRLRCKELKFRHMVAEDGKFLNTALRQVTQR